MKKFLGLFLLMASSVAAQVSTQPVQTIGPLGQPDCQIGPIVSTSTGFSPPFDNRFAACTTWVLSGYGNGHMTGGNIQLEGSQDLDGTPLSFAIWPAASVGANSAQVVGVGNSSGQSTYFKFFPWVRVNQVSFLPSTAAGQITYIAYGYRPKFGSDANAVGVSGTNCGPADAVAVCNPVLVGGVDAAGNVQELPVVDNGAAVPTQTVVVGGPDGSGLVRQVFVNNGGNLSVSGAGNNADAVTNTSGVGLQQGGSTFASGQLESRPFLFNGSTWDRAITCSNTTAFGPIASTTTQVIPLVGGQKIRICSLDINPSTVTAGTTDIVTGTGANCGTGTATLSGAYTLPAAAVVDITPSTLSASSPLTAPVGTAVCVRTVTSTVNGFIVWEQH